MLQFRCSVCWKGFRHPMSLTLHRDMHSGKTKCPVCKRAFSRVHDMRTHVSKKHCQLTMKIDLPARHFQKGVNKNRGASSSGSKTPSTLPSSSTTTTTTANINTTSEAQSLKDEAATTDKSQHIKNEDQDHNDE